MVCTARFEAGHVLFRLVEVQEKLGTTLAELETLRKSNESLRTELENIRMELEDKEAAAQQQLQV